jgi:hypothetical protein
MWRRLVGRESIAPTLTINGLSRKGISDLVQALVSLPEKISFAQRVILKLLFISLWNFRHGCDSVLRY